MFWSTHIGYFASVLKYTINRKPTGNKNVSNRTKIAAPSIIEVANKTYMQEITDVELQNFSHRNRDNFSHVSRVCQ
jgi:hypothetical protein